MVLRVILIGLLLATIAGKVRISADLGGDNISGRVIKVLNERGIIATTDVGEAHSVLPSAIHFHAPGCDQMVEVVPISINLQEAPLFDKVIRPSYGRQFAYLDRTWLTEDRLGMRLTWIRNKALSIFGLGRFVTSTKGLLIASPPSCEIAQTIDWSLVWDIHTVAAVRFAE